MSKAIILEITEEKWKEAQHNEHHYWSTQGADGDDWNAWWQEKFQDYKFLPKVGGLTGGSMLEVGCGPFANNAKRILNLNPFYSDVHLADPLMEQYVNEGKSCASFGKFHYNDRLEDMNLPRKFDLIVCINVLDHVQNVRKCFERMYSHLFAGGFLIVGNCLSNEEDLRLCPESWEDPKHPIKMDLESLAPFLFLPYQAIFLKILPREQGRNPKAHYATLLWAGKKL